MLKFIYGVMGSSKSAQALITRFNYIKNGFDVILLKPSIDTRQVKLTSRIGLEADCISFSSDADIRSVTYSYVQDNNISLDKAIIIVDEVQFCTKEQIEELKDISENIDVFCYGLKINFKSELFEGSKRLIEIADEFEEIKHICRCGKQAIINARYNNGQLVLEGDIIQIGDSEYRPLCYKCWREASINQIAWNNWLK